MVKKQLQYTYYLLSKEVKAINSIKLDQLIEYNMRNIFVEKSYIECGGETIPRLFSKKLKWSISQD